MNNTNTVTPVNGNFYNALKPYQQEFIRMVANWWMIATRSSHPHLAGNVPDSFARDTLRTIAIHEGISSNSLRSTQRPLRLRGDGI